MPRKRMKLVTSPLRIRRTPAPTTAAIATTAAARAAERTCRRAATTIAASATSPIPSAPATAPERTSPRRPLALELAHEAGELEQPPGRRGGAPAGDRPEEERDVAARAQQERDGGREDGVLGELRGRDEVREEAVVRRPREPVEGRGEDDHDDRGDRDP